MVSRRARGFSLAELVFVLAIFGILLLIATSLQWEMMKFDNEMRIEWLKHPEAMAVVARVRKDILDSSGYPEEIGDYEQTTATLILSSLNEDDEPETVVWDFREEGTARRLTFYGSDPTSEWITNATPNYEISSFEMPDGSIAVRLIGYNDEGRLVVDQILNPRKEM
ncbi:MAG TPA: prepilin-type N-terminal cleavage/methylation domain-containing protein [Thermoanaerobaculia bacterium]